jgi:hypothetical protein
MAIVPVLCVTLTLKFFYENIGVPPLKGTGTVLNAFDNIISVQESLFGFPDSGVKPLNPFSLDSGRPELVFAAVVWI